MLCQLSNRVPQEPVVSKHNGALYERRLIEKFLDEHGKCPLSGQPMAKADLIVVSGASGSSGGAIGSIPSLLATLQSEWDSVMLEQFSLRQQLSQAHQELSHALYQHEASCRVIAKLMRERDGLFAKLRERDPTARLSDDMDETSEVLPKEIVEEIDLNMSKLKEQRHRRAIPHNLAPIEEVEMFGESDSARPHSTGAICSGILCVAVVEGHGRSFALTGGTDGRVSCYDIQQRSLRSSMIGHTKAVRCVSCVDDIVLSGSDDSTVRLWKDTTNGYQGLRVVKAHSGGVIGFAVLPSKRHLLSAGADGRLAFTDFERGFTLATGESADATTGFSCLGLHPDGMVAVTGSAGKLMIWDVKQMGVVLAKGDGSQGAITGVCFNDDGYTMAASTGHGPVKLYDFRNIDKPIADLMPFDATAARQTPSNNVSFSNDGTYLAVASHVVQIWDWKSNRDIVTLSSHTEPVTDIAWGEDAHWLASVSLDKTLRVFRKR